MLLFYLKKVVQQNPGVQLWTVSYIYNESCLYLMWIANIRKKIKSEIFCTLCVFHFEKLMGSRHVEHVINLKTRTNAKSQRSKFLKWPKELYHFSLLEGGAFLGPFCSKTLVIERRGSIIASLEFYYVFNMLDMKISINIKKETRAGLLWARHCVKVGSALFELLR